MNTSMNVILNLLQVAQVISALIMVGLILMQHGKGADMGAAFGSGASGSIFGASGSANFFSRATAIMATVFLGSTLALAYFGFSVRTPSAPSSVLERAAAAQPAASAASPAEAAIPSNLAQPARPAASTAAPAASRAASAATPAASVAAPMASRAASAATPAASVAAPVASRAASVPVAAASVALAASATAMEKASGKPTETAGQEEKEGTK